MSHSGGRQSSVGVYSSRYVGNYGTLLQVVLIFSLCGLPFLGVFFRKHGLFSGFCYCYGPGIGMLIRIAFLLSYVYSVRLSLILLRGCRGLNRGYSSCFLLIGGLSLLSTFLN